MTFLTLKILTRMPFIPYTSKERVYLHGIAQHFLSEMPNFPSINFMNAPTDFRQRNGRSSWKTHDTVKLHQPHGHIAVLLPLLQYTPHLSPPLPPTLYLYLHSGLFLWGVREGFDTFHPLFSFFFFFSTPPCERREGEEKKNHERGGRQEEEWSEV